MKKRICILTGGGDVPPLNSILASAKDTANTLNIELLGAIKGWDGILKENYIDLSKVSVNPTIGGTILKSSRVNINKVTNGPEIALDKLKKNNIVGLIVIGGNDTLSNSFSIESFPQILISKTIDNDVGKVEDIHKEFKLENIINYFTLGFPTAASKICSYVSLREGLRTTAYSHERIIIVESMGMNSGWLALSSGMGFPDFIIIPEFPLNYDLFLEKVREKYNSQRHLIIVISEGAKWMNDSFIYAEKDESEDFGHPRFGGSSATLRARLKEDLRQYFNTRNINAVNPSYLYRSGRPNELDLFWAQRLGETAVKFLVEGINGAKFLAINKDKSGFQIKDIQLSDFNSMNEFIRFVDERFYDQKEFQITDNGRKYFREIIPEIPFEQLYGLESLSSKLEIKITN